MRRAGWAVLLGAAVLGSGCTAAPAPEPTATPAADPVVPPAACVLDVAALSAATGLTWAADETTASDRRCVYDPESGSGTDFVTVELVPAGSAPRPTSLDTLAEACAGDTRVVLGADGFVCRFPGGGVFAARDRSEAVLTVAAAEVPAGTTADQLIVAFTAQVTID